MSAKRFRMRQPPDPKMTERKFGHASLTSLKLRDGSSISEIIGAAQNIYQAQNPEEIPCRTQIYLENLVWNDNGYAREVVLHMPESMREWQERVKRYYSDLKSYNEWYAANEPEVIAHKKAKEEAEAERKKKVVERTERNRLKRKLADAALSKISTMLSKSEIQALKDRGLLK